MTWVHAILVTPPAAAGLAFALLGCPLAHADIYRCVEAGGEVSYRDSPCPEGFAMSANITELLQVCTTPECEAQQERARASAEERLKAERAALSEMQDRRLRAEEQEVQRRLQLEQLDRLDAQVAAQREAQSGVYYPAYPLYGGGLGYGHLQAAPCKGTLCTPRPFFDRAHRPPHRREPAVSSIAPGPKRTWR